MRQRSQQCPHRHKWIRLDGTKHAILANNGLSQDSVSKSSVEQYKQFIQQFALSGSVFPGLQRQLISRQCANSGQTMQQRCHYLPLF